MERKDETTSRIGLHEIREARLDAGALITKRQRFAVGLELGREADAIFFRLNFVPAESLALSLGLNHSGRDAINIEEVVRETVAGFQREFPDGYAAAG